MIKVKYVGSYREPHLVYRGEVFTKGSFSEVPKEWYELHKGGKLVTFKRKVNADGDSSSDN